MKDKKIDSVQIGIIIVMLLCVIALIWLFFCGFTQDQDYGCKQLGYNKYIPEFNACIDKDAKLHFVTSSDTSWFSLEAFVPYYKPIYEELT